MAEPAKPPSATVLLVDDDEDALQLLQVVMSRAGYAALTATTGVEAVEMAKSQAEKLDTIVLDLMMPGELDGYDVCDRLQESEATSPIPVIVLSACGSSMEITRSYAAGAVQHLTKPYDIQHLLAVIASMIRLRRSERDLARAAKKYRAILDNNPIEMLLLDHDLHILEMNRAFRDSFPQARIGDVPAEIIYDISPFETETNPLEEAVRTGSPQSGVVHGISRGRTVHRRVQVVPLVNADGEVDQLVDITEDVTEQVELEERLRRQIDRHNRAIQQQDLMAEGLMKVQRQLRGKNQELETARDMLQRLSITDDLTGLLNKRRFDEIIANETKRSNRYGHSLSLLMMDIDHFKKVNDTHGHPAGNVVLQELAKIISFQLRDTDSIVRYGGEEFVAVLPETPLETAQQIGERLRATMEEHPFVLPDGKTIHCTISIGVAAGTGESADGERLLAKADEALYEAKNTGRNRVCLAEAEPE